MKDVMEFCKFVIENTNMYAKYLSYSTLENCQKILLYYVNKFDPVINGEIYKWLNDALNAINIVLFE